MPVRFIIPGPLRELAGNQDEVLVKDSPETVADALTILWTHCPGVRDRVVTELGEVRQHVNVFVDGESIRYSGGLAASVGDGAEIVILPAVSGG